MKVLLVLFPIVLTCRIAAAEPTEIRDWQSTAGTTLRAKATGMENGNVLFEREDGRKLTVPLDKLSPADQAFLSDRFAGSDQPDLAHPLGQTTGPVDAGGSSYYVYLPTTLKKNFAAPLLFFTNSGGGSAGIVDRFKEGAEVCGWIVACSVESRNGGDRNDVHSLACVNHLKAHLPVDAKRVYFSGNSGGARMAFFNASKIESAGVFAFIAGGQPEEEIAGRHYFFVSGSYDYNRYGTARSYASLKRTSAFRLHPKGHDRGPGWLCAEGMIWLEGMWHRSKPKSTGRIEFEGRFLAWIDGLRENEPLRAAWWTNFAGESKVLPAHQTKLDALSRSTAADPDAKRYIEAISELEKFASDIFAKIPPYAPDCFNHTTDAIQRAADKLIDQYGDLPGIGEILESLKKPTDRG